MGGLSLYKMSFLILRSKPPGQMNIDKPAMDAKATLFEGILLEFNWGQHTQQFRSLDLNGFTPNADRILTEGALKDQIAVYLRWCSHIAAMDKSNNSALIVLGNDCQIAIQKAQGLVF